MASEFEVKYRSSPRAMAALKAACGPFETITMETTYYDAADGALSARRWTLRRRLENGKSVCTLKTPGGGLERGEYEVACGDILSAVPALIAAGAPKELEELVSGGIAPTCGARFTRLACRVAYGASEMELALDEGVLLGGGRELPFREVEVEQKRGPDDSTRRFAAALAQRFSLTPQPQSKLQRAKGLLNSAPRWGSWQAERPD